MRALAIAMLFLVSAGFADGQKAIRQVDFKNFTYPLSGPKLGHDHLRWLDISQKGQVRLRRGKDPSGSFTLSAVKFADVTGDATEEAIVVLHYDTGGTQQTDYIYIYSFDSGEPKLLAYCYTGDRAQSGLYKVYGRSGKLVVELHDPEKAIADCCSMRFIRTRYEWRNGRFVASGPRQFGAIKIQGYSPSDEPFTRTAHSPPASPAPCDPTPQHPPPPHTYSPETPSPHPPATPPSSPRHTAK